MMKSQAHSRKNRRGRWRGIALLDALLAVTIFSLAVSGLATWLNKISENSNQFAKERLIQHGLTAILSEARERGVNDMNFESRDEDLGVTYRTSAEPVDLTTTDGDSLEDMYVLKAVAEYTEGSYQVSREVEMFVYKPEENRR
jgi:Tfp pilus assembly protein PilV